MVVSVLKAERGDVLGEVVEVLHGREERGHGRGGHLNRARRELLLSRIEQVRGRELEESLDRGLDRIGELEREREDAALGEGDVGCGGGRAGRKRGGG